MGPHTDTWLDYPCPKHPDVTVRLGAGDVVIKADGRAACGISRWHWATGEKAVAIDRERLLWQGAD